MTHLINTLTLMWMWKVAVIAYNRVLSWHLPRETKEKHETADRITNVMASYLSQKSFNANQKCYHLSQLAQSQII
jgi:hypothetical protein